MPSTTGSLESETKLRRPVMGFRYAIQLLAVWWLGSVAASAEAWPVERQWTKNEEVAYSQWVAQLGQHSWKSTNQLLHDAEANSLSDAADLGLSFYADCGDFPFVLRAYYSYKRRLPMILNVVDGGNYSPTPNRTVSQIDNVSFAGDVQAFFRTLPDLVNTANFRSDPTDGTAAFYPVAISQSHLRPGVVFYDPNGHAAVVCDVGSDGSVKFLDAHPDQSVTRTTFGEKFRWRTAGHEGGFLAFRQPHLNRGKVEFDSRTKMPPGFSVEQHGFGDDYHLQVQLRLSSEKLDPVHELETYIRNDTHQEALDRVAAVERGWAFGEQTAIALPSNIYSCTGPWEDFATPGRDIRLRISFLTIPKRAAGYLRLAQSQPDRLAEGSRNPGKLATEMIETQRRLFAKLTVDYKNSRGEEVSLTLGDIEDRLFRLSFDPNHPPELRWGAIGRELASAPRTQARYFADYQAQQRWRNRMERRSGVMSPTDDDNPWSPPSHDISAIMGRLAPSSETKRERRFRLFKRRRTDSDEG